MYLRTIAWLMLLATGRLAAGQPADRCRVDSNDPRITRPESHLKRPHFIGRRKVFAKGRSPVCHKDTQRGKSDRTGSPSYHEHD